MCARVSRAGSGPRRVGRVGCVPGLGRVADRVHARGRQAAAGGSGGAGPRPGRHVRLDPACVAAGAARCVVVSGQGYGRLSRSPHPLSPSCHLRISCCGGCALRWCRCCCYGCAVCLCSCTAPRPLACGCVCSGGASRPALDGSLRVRPCHRAGRAGHRVIGGRRGRADRSGHRGGGRARDSGWQVSVCADHQSAVHAAESTERATAAGAGGAGSHTVHRHPASAWVRCRMVSPSSPPPCLRARGGRGRGCKANCQAFRMSLCVFFRLTPDLSQGRAVL
jgi:hypothetical protein